MKFGAVIPGAMKFGAVILGAMKFGTVVFGAEIFRTVIFGAMKFGAVLLELSRQRSMVHDIGPDARNEHVGPIPRCCSAAPDCFSNARLAYELSIANHPCPPFRRSWPARLAFASHISFCARQIAHATHDFVKPAFAPRRAARYRREVLIGRRSP